MAVEGSGTGAIEAGRAFVRVFLEDGALQRGFARIRARVQAFGVSLTRLGAGVGAAGAAIAAPLAAVFGEFVTGANALEKMSRRVSTSVESLSELKYAAEQSGQGIEQIESALASVNGRITEARLHNQGAIQSFFRLGLTWQQLDRLSPDKRLEAIAEAVSKVRNPTDQATAATTLLGGAGVQLLPLLQGGAKGVRALREEAQRMGATMTGETAQSAARAAVALARLNVTARVARNALGEALAPAITELITTAVPFVVGLARWVKDNKALVVTTFAVGSALVAAGAALTAFGLGVTGVTLGFGALASAAAAAIAVIKGGLILLASPLGLVATALATVSYLLATQTEEGKQLAGVLGGKLAGAWGSLRDTAVEAWGGIASALKRGDLAAAGEIALAGLYVVWRQGIALLQEAWYGLKDSLIGAFSSALLVIQNLWTNTTAYLQKRFTDMLARLLGRAGRLAQLIGADSLAESLSTFAEGARQAGVEIERERQDTTEKRGAEAEVAAAERRRQRAEALRGPRQAVEDARAAFKKLLAEEAVRAEVPTARADTRPGLPPALGAQLGTAARGTFASAGIGLSLGIGDTIAQQQLTATNQVRDAVKDVEAAVKNAGGVFGEN